MKQSPRTKRVTKGVSLDTHAKLFRGLADAARLSLLLSLRSGPRSAGDLAKAARLTPSNASNHLRCLLECGLVRVEAHGRQNLYSLAGRQLPSLLAVSEAVLRTHAGPLIQVCRRYGPPSRRDLRAAKR